MVEHDVAALLLWASERAIEKRDARIAELEAIIEARDAELARLRADNAELLEALKPFSEAARLAAAAGRPPFDFCGADDYERARDAIAKARSVT